MPVELADDCPPRRQIELEQQVRITSNQLAEASASSWCSVVIRPKP